MARKVGCCRAAGSLPNVVRANGAIAICNVERLRGRARIIPIRSRRTMPWQRSIDIDTDFDVRFAEFLLQN